MSHKKEKQRQGNGKRHLQGEEEKEWSENGEQDDQSWPLGSPILTKHPGRVTGAPLTCRPPDSVRRPSGAGTFLPTADPAARALLVSPYDGVPCWFLGPTLRSLRGFVSLCSNQQ